MKVLIAHAHEPPPPPSHLNPDVPDDVEVVIMRCLQKNPADRFQTAAELATADRSAWRELRAELEGRRKRRVDRHRFRRDPDGYLRGLEAKLNQSALPP